MPKGQYERTWFHGFLRSEEDRICIALVGILTELRDKGFHLDNSSPVVEREVSMSATFQNSTSNSDGSYTHAEFMRNRGYE